MVPGAHRAAPVDGIYEYTIVNFGIEQAWAYLLVFVNGDGVPPALLVPVCSSPTLHLHATLRLHARARPPTLGIYYRDWDYLFH